MADTENAGIAINAQAARPINIERFMGVSLSQPQQRRCIKTMPLRCESSPSCLFGNDHSPVHLFKLTETIYCAAINPPAVATIQRLPQRTIESMRPTPGTVSPRVTVQTPSGPSRIAVAPRTSRTVQPSMVVGLVSGTATIVSRGGTKAPGADVFACTTEAAREDAATPGVPSEPVVNGVLRPKPSLPADFVSASGL